MLQRRVFDPVGVRLLLVKKKKKEKECGTRNQFYGS
jgi:hypothetical protein